jgi:anti-sigma regulatory factor (Ser/Thr protein kinase)
LGEVELRISQWPEGLAQIRGAVQALSERHHLSDEVGEALVLALEELVVNIFNHGAGGEVSLRIVCGNGKVEAEVVDSGPAFDPLAVGDPDVQAGIDERPFGGLGVFLVKNLMDRVHYRRSEGHNHVYLVKRLAPGKAPEQAEKRQRRR